MKLLPKWVLTDKYPAFYDSESASAIEQTAKVYGAMQDLITDYNQFVDEINTAWSEYMEEGKTNADLFQRKMEQLFADFVHTIELKYQHQDLVIQNAINEMVVNLPKTLETTISTMYNNGEIDEVVVRAVNNLKADFDKVVKSNEQYQSDLNANFENLSIEMEGYKSELTTEFSEYKESMNGVIENAHTSINNVNKAIEALDLTMLDINGGNAITLIFEDDYNGGYA